MKILACIVAFNPGKYEKYIARNIETLSSISDVSILIVENDGNEKVINNLKKSFKNVSGISYQSSLKVRLPGEAFNDALHEAERANYDYVYFLDQDSLIFTDTISLLKNETLDFSFLASSVISEEDDTYLPYFRGNLNDSMTFHSAKQSNGSRNKINAAGYTGLLINMSIVRNNNIYINNHLKIELDDYDFTYRLSRIKPGILVPESKVTHPNKKPDRNNFCGEVLDAYLQLFEINRTGRAKMHVENYLYLIDKYGKGTHTRLKKELHKCMWINTMLLALKRFEN
ncbi:hypothetical protein ACSKF1_04900 [Lactiplantibacillus plantarum]|uniref:hypothetical protein n=1 Tax=Lactiplantibacillus plantarum TaxID=1590 RepID=UPI003F659453